MKDKMSRSQKFFLIGSCIFFAATIYSLFFLKLVFIIIFLLLHCLCLYAFSYVCFSDQLDRDLSLQTYHQDVGLEIAEKDKELNDISVELKAKNSLLEEIRLQLENFRSRAEASGHERQGLLSKIHQLEEEKRERECELNEKKENHGKDYGALLPPVTGDEEGRETVNIIAVANQAKDSLLQEAKAANLHVTVSSATDKLMVTADQGRLLTLFRNIIDNSIKYMKKAGSLVITISTIGDDIFIVLKDTGEGLPTEETRYIFELNYQGSNRISGNGLGLAQARAIVEYYGGTIYAKSTVGNGMGIYIQIPAGGRV